MLTPADRALSAADRLARAVEALLDHHRRNRLDQGGSPAALTQQTRAALLSDLALTLSEYRTKARAALSVSGLSA